MLQRQDIKTYTIDCLQVIAGCFIFVILLKFCEQRTSSNQDEHIAHAFVDQANKWYNVSLQDKQSVYIVQHANYAIAYLNAARHMASDTTLERMTGLDIHKLYRKIHF